MISIADKRSDLEEVDGILHVTGFRVLPIPLEYFRQAARSRESLEKDADELVMDIAKAVDQLAMLLKVEFSFCRQNLPEKSVYVMQALSKVINLVECQRENLLPEIDKLARLNRIDIFSLIETSFAMTLDDFVSGDYSSSQILSDHFSTRSLYDPLERNGAFDDDVDIPLLPKLLPRLEGIDITDEFR